MVARQSQRLASALLSLLFLLACALLATLAWPRLRRQRAA